MIEVDQSLRRLASLAIPPSLASIDDAVLDGVSSRHSEIASSRRMVGMAGAVALFAGIAGGGLAAGRPDGSDTLSPFAQTHALAPSTLLDFRQ